MSAPFVITRRVLFYETDLAGIMHFSNYFRLMEEVEHAWWRSMGRTVHSIHGPDALSWPRVSATCAYTAPVHFEDELELCLSVADVGGKSLTVQVEFLRAGESVASGQLRAACCRMEAGKFKAIGVPADLRARLLEWKLPGSEPSRRTSG